MKMWYFQGNRNNFKEPLLNWNPGNRGEVPLGSLPILPSAEDKRLCDWGSGANTDRTQLSRFYTSHLFEMPTICRIKSVLHAYQ